MPDAPCTAGPTDTIGHTLAVPRPHDDMSAYARERFTLHPCWQWCEASCREDDVPPGYTRLTGGVWVAITKGPRKGKPNYRRPVPGHARTVFYEQAGLDAWLLERERRTGQCHKCHGDGTIVAGIDCTTTPPTKTIDPCRRCGGTGAAPAEEVAPDAE